MLIVATYGSNVEMTRARIAGVEWEANCEKSLIQLRMPPYFAPIDQSRTWPSRVKVPLGMID